MQSALHALPPVFWFDGVEAMHFRWGDGLNADDEVMRTIELIPGCIFVNSAICGRPGQTGVRVSGFPQHDFRATMPGP